MSERIWKYPIITMIREKIRGMTPGPLPPMKTDHPIIGLIHDIQRLVRRKIFGGSQR